MADDWWRLASEESARAQEDMAAKQVMLDRRWSLLRAHGDRNLKIWNPYETGQDTWLATWLGPPNPGTHREADEGKLYDWLETSLGGTQ
jgi:hypothetical protein